MSLSPQARTVFSHLQSAGSITAVEAHNVHRVRSLSRRITEIGSHMRQQGLPYALTKEQKRDVTGQRYVRYHLVEKSA